MLCDITTKKAVRLKTRAITKLSHATKSFRPPMLQVLLRSVVRKALRTGVTKVAVRKTAKGAALKRWFKEDWKDVRTGKACGRTKGEKRGTPYCRPTKRVSAKTPKTSSEMTKAEKTKRVAQKKKLGQPAGKPKRVAPLRRKKRSG